MDADIISAPARLRSLDALRGFDMLWIIGASELVIELAKWHPEPWLTAWAGQLTHVSWAGLRAYDLIFPLFMFLSGVAIPYSIGKRLDEGKSATMRKIAIRVTALVLLGTLYNGLLSDHPGPPRLLSVLAQIGVAWGIAALAQAFLPSWRRRALLAGGVIATIAALQLLVPVPGHGAGILSPEGAINAWLDRLMAPGRLYRAEFDPEGLLCIFSASSLTLAGSVAGSIIRNESSFRWKQAGQIAAAGVAAVLAGWLAWKAGYPPIKALWTATFDLLAIGISLLVFAVFFALIDVMGWRRWSFPLQVIGVNSLTIYLLTDFIDFNQPAELLFGRLGVAAGGAAPIVLAAGVLIIEWLILWFLHRKKIYLRV